jgi:hypothetical protein
MRTLRLARIAAEAEGLRLRHVARRSAVRAVLAVIGLSFLLSASMFCQIAAWYWLRVTWDRPAAALILAGADLILAVILAMLAAHSSPAQVEVEALAVRNRALESATSSLAISALLAESVRLAFDLFRRPRR